MGWGVTGCDWAFFSQFRHVSFPPEAHFGIIFLSVFVTFVFMAMGFFGRTVEGAENGTCGGPVGWSYQTHPGAGASG